MWKRTIVALKAPLTSIGTNRFMPYTPEESNPVVFFDITAGELPLQRVFIELFKDTVPKLTENFRSLCTGERGYARNMEHTDDHRSPLFLKGCPFHRIIPGFIVQGGDIIHLDGRGNESSFGYELPDETFEGKAGKNLAGTVAMANKGPNRNGSQFFFNLTDSPHLDGKNVVIGQVIEGWATIEFLSNRGSRCGTPTTACWIAECGQSGGPAEQLKEIPNDGKTPFQLPGKEVLDILRPRNTVDRQRTPWEMRFDGEE